VRLRAKRAQHGTGARDVESLAEDRARELRRLHSLEPSAELCVHHTCSVMGPLFVRGEKHLWWWRGSGELVLVQQAFERCLS
jgi:hypothetical protein